VSKFDFSYRSRIDEDLLFYDGPVIEVSISAPEPMLAFWRDNNFPPFPAILGLAIIDTGASVSVVEESVMLELEIPFLDTIRTGTIHGTREAKRFNASADFPGINLTGLPLDHVPAGDVRTRTRYGGDVIMLLGRDLLRRFTVTYDGPNSKIEITT